MPTYAALTWDGNGEKKWHAGVSQVALFVMNDDGTYADGVAWNGVTAINDSPDGAEANDFYADNIKYASIRSAENAKGSISAYDYPDAFAQCDGRLQIESGLRVGQQKRKAFGLVYRTEVGNDTGTSTDDGYILHFVWNATVSPSEQAHETINENPELQEMDWDWECLPVPVTINSKPGVCSTMEADSTKLSNAKMTAIVNKVYGSANANASLPTPDELIALVAAAT